MPELIDSYMPRFDVREHHRISVRATAAVTYAAPSTTNRGLGHLTKVRFDVRAEITVCTLRPASAPLGG